MASKPSALIITGYGVNCENESQTAWERAGADVTRMHLKDLAEHPSALHDHQALMFIGGFSYGDHMGSGHVFAARLRHHLLADLQKFIEAEKLILGICNGFQVMVKLGLVPGLDGNYFEPQVALIQNDCAAFQNFWVTLGFSQESPCVFTRGIEQLELPIRHGEGKLFIPNTEVSDAMQHNGCFAAQYLDPVTQQPAASYPENPNGSLHALAGICDPTGRIFGMMPHPEAHLVPENHPRWDLQKTGTVQIPPQTGQDIFNNAVAYLSA